MLGLIGLGDYWDVEDKGDREIGSLHPNLWLKKKKILVLFTKTEDTGGEKIKGKYSLRAQFLA